MNNFLILVLFTFGLKVNAGDVCLWKEDPFPMPFSMDILKSNENQWLILKSDPNLTVRYKINSTEKKLKYKFVDLFTREVLQQGIAKWNQNKYCDLNYNPVVCFGTSQKSVMIVFRDYKNCLN